MTATRQKTADHKGVRGSHQGGPWCLGGTWGYGWFTVTMGVRVRHISETPETLWYSVSYDDVNYFVEKKGSCLAY